MPGDWEDDAEHFDDGMDALDFDGPAQGDDDWSGLEALDHHAADAESEAEHSGWDATPDSPSAETDMGSFDFDAFGTETQDPVDADSRALFTVAHPSHMLSVTASISGGIFAVELSPEVGRLTENQLAQTIRKTAELASLKGRSVQFELVSELMRRQGVDEATVSQYLTHDIGLPTPQRAAEAEALAVSQYLRETHP
ncbi:hypothetical protein [Mycobacterium sp. 48b]|uniref:hypothetical protein n=1 Tax=Mycobacterium sp. 48b TaxID=3400426 RepID=UPI003AACF963